MSQLIEMNCYFPTNQKGFTPLLLLLAITGILGFTLLVNSAPFKNGSLAFIFPKSNSFAASSNQGDIDGNGKVDIFDYNSLLSDFGKIASGLIADLDGNGKVDIFDFNTLLGNFGKTITQPTPMPSMGSGGVGSNSYAIGFWSPNPKFDTC